MKKPLMITFIALLAMFSMGLSFAAGEWVAKVDSQTIDDSQFKSILISQELLAEVVQGRSMEFQFANKQFQQNILQAQILQQLMVNEVKSINTKQQFVNPAVIQQQKVALANLLEKSLWLAAYQKHVLRPKITISPQAITNFYNANKDKVFKGASKAEATPFIEEELKLQQLQPLLKQLQAKVQSEHTMNINTNYFK